MVQTVEKVMGNNPKQEVTAKRNDKKISVPVWEKITISIDEAAALSNIGVNKLRELTSDPKCPFVLWTGERTRLIKRKPFEKFLENTLILK